MDLYLRVCWRERRHRNFCNETILVQKVVYIQSNFAFALVNNALPHQTGPRSAVGNVSGYRCVSDCRSRGREFDPGPVPYFRGD